MATTIEWIGFYNIGDVEYCAALLDDGSIQQIMTQSPHTVTPIAAPGTIAAPSSGSTPVSGWTILGFAQFGSQYVLFAKDQANGYWIWDGTNLYTAGTISPLVQLTAPGKNYTGVPTVNIVISTAGMTSPTGPSLIAALGPGADYIEQVTVVPGGQGNGFGENDLVAAYITGGGSDNQAMGLVSTGGSSVGGVSECIIINPGASLTYRAQAVFFPNPLDPGAPTYDTAGGGMYTPGPGAATAVLTIANGQVQAVAVTFSGTGYKLAPTFIVNDPGYGSGSAAVPGGIGFSGECNLEFGQCTGIVHIDGSPWDHSLGQFGPAEGSNYLSPPTIKIIGDGTGATAIVQIDASSGNSISHFVMQNYGSGYTHGIVIIEGGNNAANIELSTMPFGISGTAIEIYQSRVWIANGAAAGDEYSSPPLPPRSRVVFSVSGDPSNFDPTKGAGAFKGNNSFLRIGYHSLKQVNGFLYLLGDASLDYISGVTTQSSAIPGTNPPVQGPPTTTFNLQNADPAIGSPWPSSALIVNRKLTFANPVGVYEAPGGAARKISLPLDGFYNTQGQFNGNSENYPAAVANIFGLPVYMLLIPFTDIYTGNFVTKLVMWSGENWFTSAQSKNLTFISSQEINSVLTAWGTDGTSIFPLFQNPSTLFTKVVQSKLYGNPVYLSNKNTSSIHAIIEANIYDSQALLFYVDSEQLGASGSEPMSNVPIQVIPGATQNQVFDQNGNLYTFPPLSPPPPAGAVPGPVYGPITIGQQGRLIGFTIVTNASDQNLLSVGLAERVESPNV